MARIAFIGKFARMDDEEYIARGFEKNEHEVFRIEETGPAFGICQMLDDIRPNVVLWTKLKVDQPDIVVQHCKTKHYRTVCWVFDLYWNYHREYQLKTHPAFKADFVFTTDGGPHDWKGIGINHQLVRQGIANEECYLEPLENPKGVVFVGTDNPMNPYRTDMISAIKKFTQDFEWVGRGDPRECRGTDLNKLYARKKIVVGDSVYSPHYWSNRVVETLGRGGFLIHPEVEGLKEEYPYLVTYPRGDWAELRRLIEYYTEHEAERQEIVKKNFEWVRDHYTVDNKCKELISLTS